jgi:predicted SAM-dependent methyltransferase
VGTLHVFQSRGYYEILRFNIHFCVDVQLVYESNVHLIEHLNYCDGVRFVQECYRVLKPAGKLRIATPDLRFLIELFTENKTELQQRYISWAVNSQTDYGIYLDTFSDLGSISSFTIAKH